MYKSKLQQYCQSKSWSLPEYSTTKEGLDHCPQFKACVIVNGSTFSTPTFSKSSKEAQNLAAKLALDHLTGSSSSSPSSSSIPAISDVQQPKTEEKTSLNGMSSLSKDNNKSKGSSSSSPSSSSIPAISDVQQPKTEEKTCGSSLNGMSSLSKDNNKSKEIGHFYKSRLQTYAQRRKLLLPIYEIEREGPPHHCRFKSKVTIDGKTYESPEYFLTVKDAENAAAKVALMATTSSDGNEEKDPILYKNLLQELAQKEYGSLPVYNTLSCGPSHMPRFVSTVEVKNESFVGQEAKTKKLAELDAAKVAYNALKEFANKKVTESEADVLGTEVKPKPANLCIGDQCTSRSDVIDNIEELGNPFKSYKKVKVQPQDPDATFPQGTVIMHSDTKWVAVSNFDSIHDDA